MVIDVLDQKYKCGCNRGITSITRPSLLSKVNSIIEWDFCKFPEISKEDSELTEVEKKVKGLIEDLQTDLTEERKEEIMKELSDLTGKDNFGEISTLLYKERRDFLGELPELKPGDCFLFKGQVIAVNDEDTLVLVVSESGHGALERILTETVEPELKILFNDFNTDSVDIEEYEIDNIPQDYNETYQINYPLFKLFKDKFIAGRNFKDPLCLKCTIESDSLLFPVDVYLLDWKLRYNPLDMDTEQVPYIVDEIIAYICSNNSRLVYSR